MTTVVVMAEEAAFSDLQDRLPQERNYRFEFVPEPKQVLAHMRHVAVPVVIVPRPGTDEVIVPVTRSLHDLSPTTSVLMVLPGKPTDSLSKRLNGAVYDYLIDQVSGTELDSSIRHAIDMHRALELNSLYAQRLVNLELSMHRATDIRQAMRHDVRATPNIEFPRLAMGSRLLPLDGIGGDFLGSFQLPGGCIGIYLGDAAGHDVSSTIIRDFIEEEIDLLYRDQDWEMLLAPEALLDYLSSRMYPVSRVYATMVYMVIDQRTHQVYYSSAGHTPFICRKTYPDADGELVNLYFSNAVMLGVEREPKYTRQQICLHNYSHITLYSDGLVSSRFDIRHEEAPCFDTEDLKYLHHFAPEDPQQFADLLINHSRHLQPQQDDIAILTIRTGADYNRRPWPDWALSPPTPALDMEEVFALLSHNIGAEIGYEPTTGQGIIVVHGKGDASLTDALYAYVKRTFRTHTLQWLIINCLDMTGMDSSFIGFLQDICNQCDEHGIRMTISIADGLMMHSIEEMRLANVAQKCTQAECPWTGKLRTVRKMQRGVSRTLNPHTLRAHETLAQLCEENRLKFGPLNEMLKKELELRSDEDIPPDDQPFDDDDENMFFGDRKL